jgi:L-amino acid N-acyltransferase YncA
MAPRIRLAAEDDAEQVLAIYAPFCLNTPVSFETEPPTPAEMRRRIEKMSASFPWLVYEQEGRILGYAYASPHRERAAYRWSADVSAYISEGFRRKGLGRALYTSLLELLRLQGYYNALAGITVPNPSSVGLHESVGFRPLGIYTGIGYKCGAWHDVGWWQLALRERDGEPAPTRPLPAIQASTEWEGALGAGLGLARLP